MVTESQKAFEAWMENEGKVIGISNVGISLPWHVAFTPEERSTFKRLWTVAEASGRKQALEEAVQICKDICSPFPTDAGNGYNEAALDCEKKIKELIK
jgi:hypothetical protein